MPTRRARRIVEDPPEAEPIEKRPGSGQDRESQAADLLAQPGLLEAAARILEERRTGVGAVPARVEEPATERRGNGARARRIDGLIGGLADGDAASSNKKAKKAAKACKAWLAKAKHMQGPQKGPIH